MEQNEKIIPQNGDKWLQNLIEQNKYNNIKPTLLLHSCCSPCSSYVILTLLEHFDITVFYYNPNITKKNEYEKRLAEQIKLIEIYNKKYNSNIKFINGDYEPDMFLQKIKGLENEAEGGERCTLCYNIRLDKAGAIAKQMDCDYFTTTLSVSPFKNAQKLNKIGFMVGKKYDVNYLFSDFKKREGYKQSIKLSHEYNLYRQDYCGCIFSENEHRKKSEQQNIKND